MLSAQGSQTLSFFSESVPLPGLTLAQKHGHQWNASWLPSALLAMSWLAINVESLDAAVLMCRFIAVPDSFVNMIPTDIRGITRNRTPQQIINILTLGNPNGVGAFFPNGLVSATASLCCDSEGHICSQMTAHHH
jgi:hypothetical protein